MSSEMDGVSSGGVLIAIGTRAWKENAHYTLGRQKPTIRRSSQCGIHINSPTALRLQGELIWADRERVLRQVSPVNPTYSTTSANRIA